MANLRRSLVLLLLLTKPAFASAANISAWAGTFSYNGIVAHPHIPIGYAIEIVIETDGACTIDFDGYQTFDHMSCRAVGSDRAIDLVYASDRDESGSNRFHGEGDSLVKMTRSSKDDDIETEWTGIQPDSAESARGHYFIETFTEEQLSERR